jgi:hypothetical protein
VARSEKREARSKKQDGRRAARTEAISKAHGDDEAGGHTGEARDEKEKAIKNNRLLRPKTGEMPEREPPPRGGAITTEGINEGPGP